MATKKQIEYIVEELPKAQPANLLKIINDSNAGIGFALKLLNTAKNKQLSAGEISEAMCVSTARVAVLLKKMEAKGLIVKKTDINDARVTIVCLSKEGEKATEEIRKQMFDYISNVINKIGMEKLQQFIALSIEVKTAMEEDFPHEPKTYLLNK